MAENAKCSDYMVSILTTLLDLFSTAIKSAYPGLNGSIPVMVTPAAQEKFGDYQCNSAMTIAQV